MRVISELPHAVRIHEHVSIPLSDGCRLAARLWLPEDAERRPVPAILEYIPYRKRDGTRARDEPMHGYFAGHGYAAVRVDLRGSGESDGVLLDEYLTQEQDDAIEVIDWIARQPWCNGAVGMMGKSWGGFNALQVAARKPPALRAVITVCSTDDRYADDIHYMGGCLLNDNLWWGSIMLAYMARPPDRALRGEDWRRRWLERLQAMPFFPALWLAHQRRDDYWKHGSVCEDYGAIRCPVYAVGGWSDGYSNAVLRLLAGLRGPRKGLIGPWAHLYPQDGRPGPAIGFLQEALRWWDHWLKDRATGIMDEPMLRVWLQEAAPAMPALRPPGGRWIAEERWPSERTPPATLRLNRTGLGERPEPETELSILSPQTVGLAGGDWCGFGVPGEAPLDQRVDDGGALLFDSPPLADPLEILGAAELHLELAVDRPVALLCARLSDAAPNGATARVSYAILNLTHRASHETPAALVPGAWMPVTLRLNDIAHAFAPGHRIRLALSTSYWPLVWPSPEPATARIRTGVSRLVLPVRRSHPADAKLALFPPAESARPAPASRLRDGQFTRQVTWDQVSGECRQVIRGEGGLFGEGVMRLDEIGVALDHEVVRETCIHPDDPLSARATVSQRYAMDGAGWRVRIETLARMWSSAETFELEGKLVAYEDDMQVSSREWRQTIRRDLL